MFTNVLRKTLWTNVTGLQKQLKHAAKTKEDLSKRQPEQLLEQYVSSSVKTIATTESPVQEEVKAQDVVSALKNVPKENHRNSQASKSKNVTTPGQPRGKAREFNRRRKARGKAKASQKQIERQGTRHSCEQKPDEKFWQGKEEHIQGSRLWKRKERRTQWRQDRRKIERSKTFR